jgi:OOP family OmpA-OmpF porin
MGANFDAVGVLPITEDFSAFARIGAIYTQTRDSFSANGSIPLLDATPEKNDLNYKFGAGLQYAFTDAIGMRLEAERYRVNDAVGNDGDIDFYSIGLTYRFGASEKAASAVEKVVAPEKEEVLILVTQTDAHEKIQESLLEEKIVVLVFEEIHFEFDKSLLSVEAKDALTRDIAPLKMNPKIKMSAAGHTSASGSEEYNQGLSERRAQAVKDYLVQEKLVSADNISVIGYGKTKPAMHEADPSDLFSKAAKANMRVLLKIIQD